MLKRTFSRLNSIENYSPKSFKSKQSISIQTDPIQQSSKSTNTPNYLDDMLIQGKNMNDEQFEKLIKGKSMSKRSVLKRRFNPYSRKDVAFPFPSLTKALNYR
jgi:hypothetical protein